MHQHDHADATLVPGIDAVDVASNRVGTFDAEHDRGRALCSSRGQAIDRPDDEGTGIVGLPLDPGELCLDRVPRAPADVPACDDRVAHRLCDRGIDTAFPQRVESDLGRRTHRHATPHAAERLRDEPRAVDVQIEHNGPAVKSFAVVDVLRHEGHASNTIVRSRTVAGVASPPSSCSARSARRSRCQIAGPSRSSSVEA